MDSHNGRIDKTHKNGDNIGRRILVVDDNLPTRRTIEIGLKTEGFKVDIAVNGNEALDRLRERAYDYVLSDVQMPEKGGLDLMAEGQCLCTNAKWILMSAHDFAIEAIQKRNLRPYGILKKPFRIADILKLVEDCEGKGH
jgi:DNA-binding NtrC family response regulator